MGEVSTVGIDLAKSVFQLHGSDPNGAVVLRKKLRRDQVIAFFSTLPRCVVAMEACASAHYWAREISAAGHDFGRILDHRFDAAVEPEAAVGARQQTEGLEHAAHHVGQPGPHADELRPCAQKRSRLLSIQRLHMNGSVPAGADYLRQPFCIVLVGLVQPHLQRRLHPACVQDRDVETSGTQAVHKPRRHRAGLEAQLRVGARMF